MRENNPKKFSWIIFCFMLPFTAVSQTSFLSLDKTYLFAYESFLNADSNMLHSSIKPYSSFEFNAASDSKKNAPYNFYSQSDSSYRNTVLYQKTTNPEIRWSGGKNTVLNLRPLMDLHASADLANGEAVFEKSIGLGLHVVAFKKLALKSDLVFSNSSFPAYIDSLILKTGVVPGSGIAYKGKNDTYNYIDFNGYISYTPSKYFSMQLGNGKNFFGDGYRSLLLSDNANSYPFLKLNAKVWKLKYVILYTSLKTLTHLPGKKDVLQNKYSTIHYLNWNANKRISIGLFEAVVWQNHDSTMNWNYDVNYLNPVIFFRPVEYSIGSADNALIGLNFKIKLLKKLQLYGQVMLDEFYLTHIRSRDGWWANKQGYQAGFKCFDLLRIKHLYWQQELNVVRPYTYSHGNPQQNYTHFNQSLTHPLGANFVESVSIVNYQFLKYFMIEAKYNFAVYGEDYEGLNFGKNIFESYVLNPVPKEVNNYITQGLRTTLNVFDMHLFYMLNQRNQLRIEAGYLYRSEKNRLETNTASIIYIGLKTSVLSQFYRDF